MLSKKEVVSNPILTERAQQPAVPVPQVQVRQLCLCASQAAQVRPQKRLAECFVEVDLHYRVAGRRALRDVYDVTTLFQLLYLCTALPQFVQLALRPAHNELVVQQA